MHQKNYKRRIEKFHGDKCTGGVVRSFSPIMTAYAKKLEEDDQVVKYTCNYPITIVVGEYTSDFVVTLKDGSIRVRECCTRTAPAAVRTARLLDASRNYWIAHGVSDWGLVVNAKK